MAFGGSQYCWSFFKELLEGIHDFRTAGHTFKLALYTSDASLDANTTAYTATGEITGGGYSAGGLALTSVDPAVLDVPYVPGAKKAVADFADAVFTGLATGVTPRGALLYNDTATGNPAVMVIDFGSDKEPQGGVLTVTFPAGDAANGIIRIGRS